MASSKLFPSLLFFCAAANKKTVLFSCSKGRKSKREISRKKSLDWHPLLTSHFQSFWSLLYFSLLGICRSSEFLRDTQNPFLSLESACTNCHGTSVQLRVWVVSSPITLLFSGWFFKVLWIQIIPQVHLPFPVRSSGHFQVVWEWPVDKYLQATITTPVLGNWYCWI